MSEKPKREPKIIKKPLDEFTEAEPEPKKYQRVKAKKEEKPIKEEPQEEKKVKIVKEEKPKKEPRPIIIRQVIKKEKKAPTAYNLHIAKEVKAGKSFKEATQSWGELKAKK